MGTDIGLIKAVMTANGQDYENDYDYLADTDKEEILKKAEDKYIATAFMFGASRSRYGSLIVDLQNAYVMGEDKFPATLTEAYNMMANYTGRVFENGRREPGNQGNMDYKTGLSFAQKIGDEEAIPGSDGVLHGHIRRHGCGKKGHYKNKCPVVLTQVEDVNEAHSPDVDDKADPMPKGEDEGMRRVHFGFVQVGSDQLSMFQEGDSRLHGLRKDWVLLHTQSNCDIFNNPTLLQNIREEPGPGLVLHSNGQGKIMTNKVGDVKGYGKVWFSPFSIANILSFSNVRKKFPVKIVTGPQDERPSIKVHRRDGSEMSFKELENGLYVHAVADNFFTNGNTKVNTVVNYSCLNTIADREVEFTPRQVDDARKAIFLYRRIGRPSLRAYYNILENNLIRDCPVTSADAKRAQYIYGVDIAVLKGKTRRTKPMSVPTRDLVPLPNHVLKWHSKVTLCVDLVFVNQMTFLHTISRNLCFRTVEYLSNQSKKTLLEAVDNVIRFYHARGLKVEHVRGDHQFHCLGESLAPIQLHITAAGEHVPEVERSIQTLKADCRTTSNALIFERFPPLMIKSLVEYHVHNRNLFPAANGVSTALGPATIMTGLPIPSFSDFPLAFGDYAQVHDHPNVTNNLEPRTTGAIALSPANRQGGWYFMSLTTGDRLIRYKWSLLPMPLGKS